MQPLDIYLYLFDTLADWEAGYATAGLNQPAYQTQPGRYAVRTIGASRQPVRTAGGVTVLPDLALGEVTPNGAALLILPGGAAWDAGHNGEAVELARRFLAEGVPVAAICGATAGLARAGLLDGRRHTSNGADYLAAQPGYHGQAHYVAEPAVLAGDLITASGTAPVHFARRIFERLDVYAPPVLDAWFALHAAQDSSFQALAAGVEVS